MKTWKQIGIGLLSLALLAGCATTTTVTDKNGRTTTTTTQADNNALVTGAIGLGVGLIGGAILNRHAPYVNPYYGPSYYGPSYYYAPAPRVYVVPRVRRYYYY